MSSTNRSDARQKHIADYYITPQKSIHNFLDVFLKDENIKLDKKWILDPCAWWDNINDMSYPTVILRYWTDYNHIITNDIRNDSPATYTEDFLNWKWSFRGHEFDFVITNPPFNIAQDIINESLECCKEWWYVIMLLRLNYFWGKVRQDFWKKHMPIRAYVHNRRMSFTPDWKTDSVEYMHCVWKKWVYPKETKLSLIFDF